MGEDLLDLERGGGEPDRSGHRPDRHGPLPIIVPGLFVRNLTRRAVSTSFSQRQESPDGNGRSAGESAHRKSRRSP